MAHQSKNIGSDEVITRLCSLCTEVGERLYDSIEAHDCFCGHAQNTNDADFKFYSRILDWIEEIVEMSLPPKSNREGK